MACPDEVSGKVRREKCSPVPLPPKLEKCATSLRKLKWTAEMTHCLIEKVRGRPVLWDHNHELFNKIIYKKLKWREVADDLQQLFPELLDYGLAEDDVQKKFGTLKSTFQREVRKRLQYPEGSITSRWEYFKTCSFMLGLINNETSKLSYSVYPSQDQTDDILASDDEDAAEEKSKWEIEANPDTINASNDPLSVTLPNGLSPLLSTYSSDDPTALCRPVCTPSSTASDSPTPVPKKRKKIQLETENGIIKTREKIKKPFERIERVKDEIIRATSNSVISFMSLLSKNERKKLAIKIIKVLQEHQFSTDNIID